MYTHEQVTFDDVTLTLDGVGPFCKGATANICVVVHCEYYPGEPCRQPTSLDDDGYPGDGPELSLSAIDVENVTCYYDEEEVELCLPVGSKVNSDLWDYYRANHEIIIDAINE